MQFYPRKHTVCARLETPIREVCTVIDSVKSNPVIDGGVKVIARINGSEILLVHMWATHFSPEGGIRGKFLDCPVEAVLVLFKTRTYSESTTDYILIFQVYMLIF